MNKLTLINIPVGERGIINGKWYEAQKTDIFGTSNCLICDLYVPSEGCNNRDVVCNCPPRTFKEVAYVDYYDCYNDHDEWGNTKIWHFVVILIMLIIPMGIDWIIGMILKLVKCIINKIKKWQKQ